tara:strand:+ start:156 stop:614 length:459 start_codon:yes stop_codon:yes gene_type:complete
MSFVDDHLNEEHILLLEIKPNARKISPAIPGRGYRFYSTNENEYNILLSNFSYLPLAGVADRLSPDIDIVLLLARLLTHLLEKVNLFYAFRILILANKCIVNLLANINSNRATILDKVETRVYHRDEKSNEVIIIIHKLNHLLINFQIGIGR